MNKIFYTLLLLGVGCSTQPKNTVWEAKEEVDSRYEVRVGFSDYTYSNGTWKDMVFTSPSLKESENFLNEHKSDLTHLVIYDLRSGNVITTSTP
jgi:hypothetical protein